MFQSLITLMKGAASEADEAFSDAHALPILRQQLRECAQAVSAARKALALAIAQYEKEQVQSQKLAARIVDFEERTISALENGETALAQEAAETIARLQTDQDNNLTVLDSLENDLGRLKDSVTASEDRLRALKRGARMAAVTERTQRLGAAKSGGAATVLRDAEATLARLRSRQSQTDAMNAVLDEMDKANDPHTLREKLAAAGYGAPLKTTADAVLERLRARAVKPA